jgi:hypothetical protein
MAWWCLAVEDQAANFWTQFIFVCKRNLAVLKTDRDAEKLDIVDLMRTVRLADTGHATTLRSSATPGKILHRIWPAAVIGTGLVLTAGWTCLLGYGLIQLVAPVIF